MEEVKPIAIEEYEFEYEDMLKLIAFSQILHHQDFNRKNKIDDSSIETSSSSRELSVEDLTPKFILLILENYEFEDRNL